MKKIIRDHREGGMEGGTEQLLNRNSIVAGEGGCTTQRSVKNAASKEHGGGGRKTVSPKQRKSDITISKGQQAFSPLSKQRSNFITKSEITRKEQYRESRQHRPVKGGAGCGKIQQRAVEFHFRP